MDAGDVIAKALIYLDEHWKVIQYLMVATETKLHHPNDPGKRSVLVFTDKETKEKVAETEVEILGIYAQGPSTWAWGWSLAEMRSANIYLSKQVLIYSLDLQPELAYIKYLITTSRMQIDQRAQNDVLIALAASFLKKPYIFPFVDKIQGKPINYHLILLNNDQFDRINDVISQGARS